MSRDMNEQILLIGTGRMVSGIATTLLKGDALVRVVSDDVINDKRYVEENIADWKLYRNIDIDISRLQYVSFDNIESKIPLTIVVSEENLSLKQQWISRLEGLLSSDTIIAINTESCLLEDLQKNTHNPSRIIGLNWSEPAHTTAFLEIISNEHTSVQLMKKIEAQAISSWGKDPYILSCGYSIRARLMAAITREAFYLIENGYATVQDIDRACRNDAGYYLPFAGNCRYMDLMGTHVYGLVMKDLNPELSKADALPVFFTKIIEAGMKGMSSQSGFYQYEDNDNEKWEKTFRKFSFRIKELIDKYPFKTTINESK